MSHGVSLDLGPKWCHLTVETLDSSRLISFTPEELDLIQNFFWMRQQTQQSPTQSTPKAEETGELGRVDPDKANTIPYYLQDYDYQGDKVKETAVIKICTCNRSGVPGLLSGLVDADCPIHGKINTKQDIECPHNWVPTTWFWDESREDIPPIWLICSKCNNKKLFTLNLVTYDAR